MAQVIITINDREYPIACENGQEARIMQLAQILDQKAQMLKSFSGKISENMLLAMIGILVADDLFEARKSAAASAPVPVQNNDEETTAKIQALNERIKAVAKLIESL
ncbi:MAG: cell division protein ZapA [Azospirillum sp.]|nr:cell division protein ZapA [Azospirillum sp.]